MKHSLRGEEQAGGDTLPHLCVALIIIFEWGPMILKGIRMCRFVIVVEIVRRWYLFLLKRLLSAMNDRSESIQQKQIKRSCDRRL